MEHRSDIDALRALAVGAVLVHHALPGAWPGGFLGVDVFFVVSGYLITALLMAEHARTGRVNLLAFAQRRALRLLPALWVVLAVVLAVGWWWAMPLAYAFTAQTGGMAVVGMANVEQGMGLGYFDPAARANPLGHVWSLSVEQQFYALWGPLVALLLWPGRRWLAVVVGVAVVVGFAWSVVVYPSNPDWAYFRTDARLWMFAVGAGVACLHASRPDVRHRPTWVVALIWSALAVGLWAGPVGPHPGWGTVPVVLATAACLHVARGARLPVWAWPLGACVGVVGRWSYALYLVHWPILVAAWSWAPTGLSLGGACIVWALSLCAAGALHHLVENPARRLRASWRGWAVGGLAAVGLLMVVAFLAVLTTRGYPGRVPPDVAALEALVEDAPERAIVRPCHAPAVGWDPGAAPEPCLLGGDGTPGQEPSWALMGDSHAMSLATGVLAAGDAPPFLVLTGNGCPPTLTKTVLPQRRCSALGIRALDALRAHPSIDTVVIHARWSWYTTFPNPRDGSAQPILDDVSAVMFRLVKEGYRVIVVGPVPQQDLDVPRALARAAWRGEVVDGATARLKGWGVSRAEVEARYADLDVWVDYWEKIGVEVVWPLDAACPDLWCPAVGPGGEPLYVDSHHLSPLGARVWAEAFLPMLDSRRGVE